MIYLTPIPLDYVILVLDTRIHKNFQCHMDSRVKPENDTDSAAN